MHRGFRGDRGLGGPPKASSIVLDYGVAAAERKLLTNVSAAAVAGDFLWTASDEGRTVECLEPHRGGYRLHRQFSLDTLFPGLPGRPTKDEVDVESLSVDDGRLWICGSHCHVRLNWRDRTRVDARFRSRPSRCLLGAVTLTPDGGGIAGRGTALPFDGAGSLRDRLRHDPYIAPFIDLPSKENGLDIEGLCVADRRLFLGLRGPVVASIAIVVELRLGRSASVARQKPVLHFLDLGGLGVRDLTQRGSDLLIMAGPVSVANGPFRLFRWRPKRGTHVQQPDLLAEWTSLDEHPEGIALLKHERRKGLLMVFDTPDLKRVSGRRYRADWIPLNRLGL
jgi:hypothetical protein